MFKTSFSRLTTLAGFLTLGLLSGCVVGPDGQIYGAFPIQTVQYAAAQPYPVVVQTQASDPVAVTPTYPVAAQEPAYSPPQPPQVVYVAPQAPRVVYVVPMPPNPYSGYRNQPSGQGYQNGYGNNGMPVDEYGQGDQSNQDGAGQPMQIDYYHANQGLSQGYNSGNQFTQGFGNN